LLTSLKTKQRMAGGKLKLSVKEAGES